MKVLVVGGGSREHALTWKIANSPKLTQAFVWPGNAFTQKKFTPLPIDSKANFSQLYTSIKEHDIDLVICGPEQPLAEGLSDFLEAKGIPVFGPCQEVAKLESSKYFAKEVMKEAGIPTASYFVARSKEECTKYALDMLEKEGGTVLKASGLAGGKGVFVCFKKEEIENGINHLYNTSMKSASSEVVVESVLKGRECSFFTFIGDKGPSTLGFAVDFKRLEEDDQGPNTGGMGCYTPVPWLPDNAADEVNRLVTKPLLDCLEKRGLKYRGCLYIGLMWNEQGLSVVEFNIRLGDPEAQILAVADDRDWLPLIAEKCGINITDEPIGPYNPKNKVVGITIASSGYPYEKTDESFVLPPKLFADSEDGIIFSAAIKAGENNSIQVGSGRVLTAVGKGADFTEARKTVYEKVSTIYNVWPTCRWRKDIAERVSKEHK